MSKNPIFTNLKKRFEHIELPAKILDYFLRSNKSNINQKKKISCFIWKSNFLEVGQNGVILWFRLQNICCVSQKCYVAIMLFGVSQLSDRQHMATGVVSHHHSYVVCNSCYVVYNYKPYL